MLDNKRRIPLGYSKDQENRLVEAYNNRIKKPNHGEKKSYSISYEVPKDDGAQNSPHFLNAITSSVTDREATELQTSLRETRVELERKAAKVENEIAMRREMRKMKEFMQTEQQRKLKELEESVNEYWGSKISKLHRDYQVQINELEKSGYQGRKSSPKKDRQRSISELAKKIEEKHYREYVHKIDEIKENFQKIDEENKMEIKREIARELEPIYKEQLSQKVQYTSPSETTYQEAERETRPKERGNRLKLRTQESLERSLVNKSRVNGKQSEAIMTRDTEKIEEELRREYQEDLSDLKKRYEDDEKELWKVFSKAELRTKEKKRREIEEKLNKELLMKEKAMELKYRQKMEKEQEALRRSFELEAENQLKEEKKSLLDEKGEIGRLKSRANIKAHKVQEAKQAFYEKLKQQEEKFAKKVDTLQKELDGLKQGHDDRSSSPTLGQLRAEYLRKTQDQGEVALTTTKWQKSLRNQGKENKSRSPGTSKSFISLKPPLSDSINERARSNQMRRKSYVAEEHKTGGYSSQSTVRENTSRMETSKEYQNPKYYLQKSMRGDGGQDSSPFNRSFNSKMSNMAVVAKKDDSNRTMKAVLDASQPPELLFSSKGDTMPLLPYRPKEERYRKQSGDTRDNITDTLPSYDVSTRRRSLIKNESSVEYGKLKAEIMSKYEPGHNRLQTADMSFMDGMGKSRQGSEFGKKTPDNALEKAKLAEQKKKEFMDKYDRSLKKLEFERSSAKKKERQYTDTGVNLDNSRALTTNPEEKYREIMGKYLDKSVSQKYEVTEKMKKSSGYGGVSGKYQELFRINEDDSAQNKSMKRFKKVIEAAIEKDNALEAKYLAREVFFTTDFITGLDNENKYLKETLKGKFRSLFEGWDVTETSYEARLSFLSELDLMLRLEDVIRKVDAECEYLSQYSYEIGEIISLVKQRNKLKGKVNVKKFDYSLWKGIYGMIDEVMGKMKVLLQDYHRLRKREIIYKGIDLSDIIKVDLWEHAYLDEIEEREVLWERVKHRH